MRISRFGLRFLYLGGGALVLTGCPLTDDYFVDPDFGISRAGAGGVKPVGGMNAGGTGEIAAGGTTGGWVGGSSVAGGGKGGSSTGGSAVGGTSTGGIATGGTETGGTITGGSATGGTETGGTETGGTETGGTAAGGTTTGGTATGGSTSICSTATCSGACCGTLCVDLASDPANCGACETACNVPRNCSLRTCQGGWVPMAPPPTSFRARQKAAYTAFDGKVFVFGGEDANGAALGDGAAYDPRTNTWTLVSTTGAPTRRRLATAVWTGSRIVVFGGSGDPAGTTFQNGASYDPATDSWSPIGNNTTARVAPIGAASTTHAVFWGGWNGSSDPIAGTDRYNLSMNTWQSAGPSVNDPGALANPAWAFTGQVLYLYGGQPSGSIKTNETWSYSLANNAWSLANEGMTTPPAGRWGAFGVWDSAAFFVWGGRDERTARNDGKYLYNSAWYTMSTTGAPSARWAPHRETGWAFAVAPYDNVFLGGLDFGGNALTNGGRYASFSTPNWTALEAWRSGEAHLWGVAAYTGGEIVLWGGLNGAEVTATGDRWAP